MLATVANMKEAFKTGKNIVMYSPYTGEEYSANPNDYFWINDEDEVFDDSECYPMVLGYFKKEFVEVD